MLVVEQDHGGVQLDQGGHAAEVCDSDRCRLVGESPVAVPGTCIAVAVVGTQLSVDVIRRSGPAAGACMESLRWLHGLVIGVHRAGGRRAG